MTRAAPFLLAVVLAALTAYRSSATILSAYGQYPLPNHSVYGSGTLEGAAPTTPLALRLADPAAVQKWGAACLDGTPPAYYILGPESGQLKTKAVIL